MTDNETPDIDLIRELVALEQDKATPTLTIQIGPFSTYALVATVQLACRHPSLQDGILRDHVDAIARQLQERMPGPIARILDRGWDEAQDR